jgi:hypothetical protein
MLAKHILILSLIFTSSWATDVENRTKEGQTLQSQEFPKTIHFLNVSAQLEKYRQIYDPIVSAYQSDSKDYLFQNLHIPGLIDMLSYGVAVIRFYIDQKVEDPKLKKQALDDLDSYYNSALKFNAEKTFTQEKFLVFNLALAFLVDYYAKPTTFTVSSNLGNTDKFKEFFKSKTWQKFYDQISYNRKWWAKFVKGRGLQQQFAPPVVIYTNPKAEVKSGGVGFETFVNQTLNYNYRTHIIVFNVKSEQKKPTKHSPHYSGWDGTFNLLVHDILHSFEQQKIENVIEDFLSQYTSKPIPIYTKLLEQLTAINEIRLMLGKKTDVKSRNDYKVLTQGLFILIHEVHNIFKIENDLYVLPDSFFAADFSSKIANNNLYEAIKALADSMQNLVKDLKRDSSYRENLRDNEGILYGYESGVKKSLHDDEGAFIPSNFKSLTDEKKQEVIADAYKRFWDYFLKVAQAPKSHEE